MWWATKISPSTSGAALTLVTFSTSKNIFRIRKRSAWNRIIARRRPFSMWQARSLRTTWNARVRIFGRRIHGATECVTTRLLTPRPKRDGSPVRFLITGEKNSTCALRCFIEQTHSRVCLKRLCVVPACPTTSLVASRSMNAWKFVTSSRT